MKLKEFINVITGMMESNKWQNRNAIFSTSDLIDREFLSMYVDDGNSKIVFIDIGEEGE